MPRVRKTAPAPPLPSLKHTLLLSGCNKPCCALARRPTLTHPHHQHPVSQSPASDCTIVHRLVCSGLSTVNLDEIRDGPPKSASSPPKPCQNRRPGVLKPCQIGQLAAKTVPKPCQNRPARRPNRVKTVPCSDTRASLPVRSSGVTETVGTRRQLTQSTSSNYRCGRPAGYRRYPKSESSPPKPCQSASCVRARRQRQSGG